MEEFLRLYTPYRGFARTASGEVCLHGQKVRPGEPITLHYTSANRDPEVFENPDDFVLHRPQCRGAHGVWEREASVRGNAAGEDVSGLPHHSRRRARF